MISSRRLAARGSDSGSSSTGNAWSPTLEKLLIALVVLLIVGIVLLGALLFFRRTRQVQKESELPRYNEKGAKTSNHRRLTIMASSPNARVPDYVNREKQILMDSSSSPPPSPVPEIRITFPEEEDSVGKRKSGRVVVVRISDSGSVGMEPCSNDPSPPYAQSEGDRFQSLDLERIGGLKEGQKTQQRWS